MRLPFLQMESDLLGHGAPAVATLAGCSPVQAVGHVAMLRAWVVSHGPDDVAPDGWVRGPDAGALIEGAAQWQGEPGRLLRALRVTQLVIQDGEAFQVVGMEPYQRAWTENMKARERMANKRGGSRNTVKPSPMFAERSPNIGEPSAKFDRASGERSAKFGEQTQTQTQTQREEEKKPALVAVAPCADVVAAPTPKKPRKEASGPAAELWRALEAKFLAVTGQPYVTGNGTVDGATVSWFLNASKATPAEVVERWGRLLEWAKGGFPTVSGFVVLRSNWNAPQVLGIVTSRPRGNGGYIDPNKFTEGEVVL